AFYDLQPSWILPNVGLGVYLSGEQFYVGLGVPELIEYDLSTAPNFEQYIREIRHYYVHGGLVWPISTSLKLKPSFLFRTVGWFSRTDPSGNSSFRVAAPSELDLDISLLMNDILWVGLSFRTAVEVFSKKTASADSGDIWVAWYAPAGFRLGMAYDFTVSRLASQSLGSLEIMIGYEFNYRKRGIVTPRYF
ncbi:MAG: type IX secretion system membrane protein PorP/SprF, partial [Phaeodactylibacter sp.]|nr:type IX secretion system membrane protein PorP/SprF [Phaeodactylibacter sp.]